MFESTKTNLAPDEVHLFRKPPCVPHITPLCEDLVLSFLIVLLESRAPIFYCTILPSILPYFCMMIRALTDNRLNSTNITLLIQGHCDRVTSTKIKHQTDKCMAA